MSVCGAEEQNQAFRPLIPGVKFIEFNNPINIDKITTKTAGVILETIQGGAGFYRTNKMRIYRRCKQRCNEVGALLILDEIQSGIGRTGTFWGFENYNVIPDLLITGKGWVVVCQLARLLLHKKSCNCLKDTSEVRAYYYLWRTSCNCCCWFGNNVHELNASDLIKETLTKRAIDSDCILQHPAIKEIRGRGLMLAAIVATPEIASQIILKCLDKGLLPFLVVV